MRFDEDWMHAPELQRLPGAMFKAWVNLKLLQSANGGTLPALKDCAFVLRTGTALKARRVIEALVRERVAQRLPSGSIIVLDPGRGSTNRMRKLRAGEEQPELSMDSYVRPGTLSPNPLSPGAGEGAFTRPSTCDAKRASKNGKKASRNGALSPLASPLSFPEGIPPKKPPPSAVVTLESVEFPAKLDSAEFRSKWAEYLEMRSENGYRNWGKKMQEKQLFFVAKQGDPIECVDYSLRNEYKRLFPTDTEGGRRGRSLEAIEPKEGRDYWTRSGVEGGVAVIEKLAIVGGVRIDQAFDRAAWYRENGAPEKADKL